MAVIEVFNVIGLERAMAGLSLIGNVNVTCEPIIPYETFARSVGVEEQLLHHVPLKVDLDDDYYFLQFELDRHDNLSMDEVMSVWKEEARFMLSARNGGLNVIMFKVAAARKVIMFVRDTIEMLDKLSFNLPIMKGAGGCCRLTLRAVQDLGTYTKNIVS